MPKHGGLLILLLLSTVTLGCVSSPALSEPKEYKGGGFSFTCPAGWSLSEGDQNKDILEISCYEGVGDDTGPIFTVEKYPGEVNLSMGLIGNMSNEYTEGIVRASPFRSAKFNGIEAIASDAKAISKADPQRVDRWMIIAFNCNKKGYMISLSALESRYENYSAKFREIEDSFSC